MHQTTPTETETATTTTAPTATATTHPTTRQTGTWSTPRTENERRFRRWIALHKRALARTERLFAEMQAAGPDETPAAIARHIRSWRVNMRCLNSIHYWCDVVVAEIRRQEPTLPPPPPPLTAEETRR